MKTAERFEKVNIDHLVPYARNARTHSKEQILQLRASIREFGFLNPALIDKDLNIIAGHGRILAAKEEGFTEIPCVFVEHLTEAQKRAYIIADNRLALNAGWDVEMLSVELSDLQCAEFDISLLGFDNAELNKLLCGMEDVKDDEFDVEAELQKPAVSELGDLWLLGKHRLVCGDSTKAETFDLLMDGKLANLTVTDPPYNVNYEGSAGKIMNDHMADDKFYQFLLDAFVLTEKAMAKDASIYVFHADTEGLNFRKAFSDAGFYLSGTCIWKKQSLVLGRSPYQWQHEPILFGWKKSGKHAWYTDRKQTTIWEFDKPRKSGDHPTSKPVQLIAYPIVNSSMTGCIVLDPFGGSGSTVLACEQTDRICYTVELDIKFCDVITKRFIEMVGSDKDVFLIRNGNKVHYSDVVDKSSSS
ncbi:site-specific DNA-methyltransferase [Acidaminobacter hydrogenoformans]|uniref:DNA modification methylase n=1 Tax=Acidaminobacter hydrogenoformans DSM 2784 TaxID=1120920 RepID=A0A1G5S208_9FIRM|nr:site-specific DNA-methyltransferase [Acidaminobacter hydrogenoformans]SCZ80432.1 DNA modification methylase [Acidaminobacter hydrogenoformans DSM 2784]